MTQDEFDELYRRWNEATAHHSNPRIICGHATFRDIVDAGDAAIPFILRKMERRTDSAMVRAMNEINSRRMDRHEEAWLAWGREKGYVTSAPPAPPRKSRPAPR